MSTPKTRRSYSATLDRDLNAAVQTRSALYDTADPNFKNCHVMNKLWNAVARELSLKDHVIDGVGCKDRFAALKKKFIRARNARLNKRSGSSPLRDDFPLYEEMTYLHRVVADSSLRTSSLGSVPVSTGEESASQPLAAPAVATLEPRTQYLPQPTTRRKRRSNPVEGLVKQTENFVKGTERVLAQLTNKMENTTSKDHMQWLMSSVACLQEYQSEASKKVFTRRLVYAAYDIARDLFDQENQEPTSVAAARPTNGAELVEENLGVNEEPSFSHAGDDSGASEYDVSNFFSNWLCDFLYPILL